LGEIRISGMPPLTKLTFAVEPPFTAISSHEIARVLIGEGLDAEVWGGIVTGQVGVIESDDSGTGVTRTFGSLDARWRVIQLADVVNFLLRHPKALEVFFFTTMRLSREYTK